VAGIAPPASVQGTDLSPALAGGRSKASRAALLAAYMPFAPQAFDYPEWRGVRTPTHTYVEARNGPLELFDDVRDPYQTDNLINRPSHAATQRELAAQLRALLAETGDRFEAREAYWKRYRLDIGDFGQVRYSTRSGT
jgi:hypothetical protein